MAYKNKVIVNPKAAVKIKFLQCSSDTHGNLLEMEATYGPQSKEPPAHYHPEQEEDFTVVEGALSIRMHGEVIILKPGAACHIPKKEIHSMWNHTAADTTVRWRVKPALQTENFLETLAGLAVDNKTNSKGVPHILQVALLSRKYVREFRLASPGYWIQKIVFAFLTPIAFVLGFRSEFPEFID